MPTKKKICTRCKAEKGAKEFRIRSKNGYTYLNPTCKKCDCEIAAIYHNEHKLKPEYMAKNAARAKDWGKRNKEKVADKNRQKRQTEDYKKYVHVYYKTKPKAQSDHKKHAWKFHERERDNLTDGYIIGRLKNKSNLTKEDILSRPDLIELCRAKIQLERLIYGNEKTNSNP